MAEIRNIVCDVCGEGPAKTYALAESPNVPWMVDLCAECAAPIRRWRDYGRQGPNKRAYRRFQKTPVSTP